jgi:fused signal recognition particle receptor
MKPLAAAAPLVVLGDVAVEVVPGPTPLFVGVALTVIVVLVVVVAVARRSRRAALGVDEEAETGSVGGGSAAPQRPAAGAGFFAGFAKSRAALADGLSLLFGAKRVDEHVLEQLEETLITADVGVKAAARITEAIRGAAGDDADLRALLRAELLRRVGAKEPVAGLRQGEPLVILVVGVNGSGKTTTIGKLASRYKRAGRSVMLAAGDTFRAGAIEQLKVWGERSTVPVIAHQEGGDPAAVIFDALQSARAKRVDVVICDTAGRLQAQKPLMDELGKVVRVMKKAFPGAPHEVLLVLDGTIGQNAMSQARVFKEVVGVTGVALTKLDGTARGGVVVAVREELGLPVKLVGLGEGIDDLRDFEPEAFVDALIGVDAP